MKKSTIFNILTMIGVCTATFLMTRFGLEGYKFWVPAIIWIFTITFSGLRGTFLEEERK